MQKLLKRFVNRTKEVNSVQKKFNLDLLKRNYLSLKVSGRPFLNELSLSETESFVTFHVYPNNIFCTYKTFNNSKFYILNSASSGKYKIEMSKKTLRHKLKFVIVSFLSELKQKEINLDNVAVRLIASVKLKKALINLISEELKTKTFFIQTDAKKVFNGCRAKKKLRKKRKKLKLFK